MRQEQEIIKDRLERLVGRMKKLGYNSYVVRLTKVVVNELQQRGVYCVDRFIQKLLDRVNEREEYLDILMEGRVGVILARNGFTEIYIEYREPGPDLKGDYDEQTVYFEVTRRRPNEEDELFLQPGAHWVEQTSTEAILGRIREKLGQFESGEINVVVYCSETVAMGKPNVEEAFKYIRQEISYDPKSYEKLSGVLFTESAEFPLTDIWEICLFKNENALRPLDIRLTKKLESLQK